MSSKNIYITEEQRIKFKPTYLMIKQHNITGLKYLCKTNSKNPIKYNGSGDYWCSHINKYGTNHIITIWYELYDNIEELVKTATNLSKKYNIVESEGWANLKPENGLDGGTTSEQQKKIQRKRISDGTHHWLGDGEFQRTIQRKRISDGTHHWLGGKFQKELAKKRIENGTHNFLNENHPSKLKIKDGTHLFLSETNPVYTQILNGTNTFINKNPGLNGILQKSKSSRPIYQQVKQIYKSKGLKLPKGLYMKSDKYLQSLL
jgi:hypothetical protein